MDYTHLGRTSLQVSRLCLGTMNWGWTASEDQARAVMDAFVEAGGNFLDTADIYSRWAKGNPGGVSEQIIGRWMKDRGNRQHMVIATKVRGPMWEGPDGEGLGRKHIQQAVEDSLRRLQTDYLDLYQAHWPDDAVPIEETMRAFDELIGQGKVRHVGASNYAAPQLAEAQTASATHGWPRYVSLQPHYNLVHRSEFESELKAFCQAQGLGVIPYSPLAGGFLTGKYRRDRPPPKSERAESIREGYYKDPQAWRILGIAEDIASVHASTAAQVALAWLISQPVITAPIIGANTPTQLEESLNALGLRLADQDVRRLNEGSAEA